VLLVFYMILPLCATTIRLHSIYWFYHERIKVSWRMPNSILRENKELWWIPKLVKQSRTLSFLVMVKLTLKRSSANYLNMILKVGQWNGNAVSKSRRWCSWRCWIIKKNIIKWPIKLLIFASVNSSQFNRKILGL
jgi:hypothetical protein